MPLTRTATPITLMTMMRRVMLLKRYWPKTFLASRFRRTRIARLGRRMLVASLHREISKAIR